MDQILEKLRNKKDLSFEESKSAFELIMTGKANENQIYDFLTLLSDKGEVSDEIAGGVYVLREKSKRVTVTGCVDTCGTGGDGMNTLNISTASALPVIKISNADLLSSKVKFSLLLSFSKIFSIKLIIYKIF